MIAWPPHLKAQMSWNVHHSEIVTATSLKVTLESCVNHQLLHRSNSSPCCAALSNQGSTSEEDNARLSTRAMTDWPGEPRMSSII